VTETIDRRLEVVGSELAGALIRGPDAVDSHREVLPKLSATGSRLGSVVRQGEIELQNFGGKRLDGDILSRKDAIGGPDEEAEDQ